MTTTIAVAALALGILMIGIVIGYWLATSWGRRWDPFSDAEREVLWDGCMAFAEEDEGYIVAGRLADELTKTFPDVYPSDE